MILAVDGITKSFGDVQVLSGVSFTLRDGEKAAIVGVNGAGKTTLLRVITGEETADSGTVSARKGASVGYLRQRDGLDPASTIEAELTAVFADVVAAEDRMRGIERDMHARSGAEYERAAAEYDRLTRYVESNRGYERESLVRGVIKGMGFTPDELAGRISRLSGGRKSRVALAKLLLTKPDLLLLDEPTNHLDIPSVEWLEDVFLKGYPGTVLIVCHDRYFLDKTVTKIIEIERGVSTATEGNYTLFAVRKADARDAAERAYQNQARERGRQEAVIAKLRQFNREKSIKRARSREKALARLPEAIRPQLPPRPIRVSLKPSVQSGEDVLSVRGLSKSFGGRVVFSGVSFELRRGTVTAVLGANGVGKTTLARIIMGELLPDAGRARFGANVRAAYFDQERERLSDAKTALAEITDAYPRKTQTEIRSALAAFRFTGDDVFKAIGNLSGGEKRRLALLKLILAGANFIVLDEPTNHLDMDSKEALEEAVLAYEGTVLYISHDRYFINATADRVIEMTPGGAVVYEGDFDYYREKKREAEDEARRERTAKPDAKPAARPGRNAEKKRSALTRKLESAIAEAERERARLDERLADPAIYADYQAARDLAVERSAAEARLAELYEEWMNINEEEDDFSISP
ncbi:MAG: ABC-F family ATP-binding cassette domain-containing protein [Clostridiales bacterium]|jgi:ATP-binding cassette subfamily F protein 3|nr:ABC-F family ATP-binding cassette domain-containing protein [Clostridiales bacterium]